MTTRGSILTATSSISTRARSCRASTAATAVLRWLGDYVPTVSHQRADTRSAPARRFAATIEADLNRAGIATASIPGGEGDRYWNTFVQTVEHALLLLNPDAPPLSDHLLAQ